MRRTQEQTNFITTHESAGVLNAYPASKHRRDAF